MNEQPTAIDLNLIGVSTDKPLVLHRPWLFPARVVWILLAVSVLVVEVALVSRLGELLLVGDAVSESFGALPRIISYATFSRLVQWSRYALLAVYNLAALLIFWRKSDEVMGLLTSLLLLLLPFWFELGERYPLTAAIPARRCAGFGRWRSWGYCWPSCSLISFRAGVLPPPGRDASSGWAWPR